MKSIYSMRDVYPNGTDSNILTVSEQTIPDHDEANYAIDNETTTDLNGTTKTTNSTMVFGAILLLVGILVVLHFIN